MLRGMELDAVGSMRGAEGGSLFMMGPLAAFCSLRFDGIGERGPVKGEGWIHGGVRYGGMFLAS